MSQELQPFLEKLRTIFQEKYDETLITTDNEDLKSSAFRSGCNYAYSDVLDVIASIEVFKLNDTDIDSQITAAKELNRKVETFDTQFRCIGIDGCRGGWICAVIESGKLIIQRFPTISDIMLTYSDSQYILIDMPVGLQSNSEHIRPDGHARKIIRERTSTIFPAPCRQAIYAENVSQAYLENERVLGKKFTPLTVGIIPKIREVDSFLQNNVQYKNRVLESHPEVCFAILNGKTVLSKKNEFDGFNERVSILQRFLPSFNINDAVKASKQYKCMIDDVIDSICLAVVSTFVSANKFYSIPERPMADDTGLLMQMILPKID